jgi:hypothetical protein
VLHVPTEGSSKQNTGLSNSIKADNLLEQLTDHQLLIKLVFKNRDFKDGLRFYVS